MRTAGPRGVEMSTCPVCLCYVNPALTNTRGCNWQTEPWAGTSCVVCNQGLHQRCFLNWARTKLAEATAPNCPNCRDVSRTKGKRQVPLHPLTHSTNLPLRCHGRRSQTF